MQLRVIELQKNRHEISHACYKNYIIVVLSFKLCSNWYQPSHLHISVHKSKKKKIRISSESLTLLN